MTARRNKEPELDTFIVALSNAPVWVGPACAGAVYVALRFVVRAILGDPNAAGDALGKPTAALFVQLGERLAPYAALFVLGLWGLAELKKFADRRRLDALTGLESVRKLPWEEFEELVGEAFRRQGYDVEHTGGATADGGVDLVLRRNGQTTLVQCKHWRTWRVDVKVARELRGVMASRNAEFGIVVSDHGFTADATDFAQCNSITLMDGKALLELVHAVQGKR